MNYVKLVVIVHSVAVVTYRLISNKPVEYLRYIICICIFLLHMDDLEDLIKLNNILKSEGASTSKASHGEVIVQNLCPNKQLCSEYAEDSTVENASAGVSITT